MLNKTSDIPILEKKLHRLIFRVNIFCNFGTRNRTSCALAPVFFKSQSLSQKTQTLGPGTAKNGTWDPGPKKTGHGCCPPRGPNRKVYTLIPKYF